VTEYELTDLMMSAANGGTAVIGIFFTILSGYLIAAWLIGEKLTRTQVIMVNILYLSSATMMIWAWIARFSAALRFQNQLLVLNPQLTESVTIYIITGFSSILFILILVSLKFMWDVRHPKTE
jgi:predicted anti-sigma-YlaC factor YlaD